MNTYLKVAKQAAVESGKLFTKSFGQATGAHAKNSDLRNMATDSDLAIEKKIRAKISKAFPKHLILGEEFGGKTTIQPDEHIWLIDPIDGTNNFIQGIPLTCISIGLWDHVGPLVAVVYNPITKDLYSAVRGQGAFLNNKKIQASKVSKPELAFGGFGWTKATNKKERSKFFTVATEKFGKARTFGSTTLQISFVADGKLDFYFSRGIYIWDFAAAALLVTEAGGTITDLSGRPLTLTSRSVVASNKKLHAYTLKNLS